MTRYTTEPRTRKYIKGYGFLLFARTLSTKCRKKLLDTATKIGLHALKIAFKKVAQKAAEAPGELIGNKMFDVNSRYVET